VGKPARNPQLSKILVAKFNGHVVPKCGTADTNVDRNIQNASTHHAGS
jgi:hypothetical protein